MTEKLYGNLPRCGKSYFSDMFNELYCDMTKKSLDATVHIVDKFIEFWKDDAVQEFFFDVSPLEVLEELKKTLVTGEYPSRMRVDEE